jgi:hypothetical protein
MGKSGEKNFVGIEQYKIIYCKVLFPLQTVDEMGFFQKNQNWAFSSVGIFKCVCVLLVYIFTIN